MGSHENQRFSRVIGDVAKWLRRGSAKPLFTGSNPVVASTTLAGVAELADAADLKSAGAILVGSSPTPGIDYGFNTNIDTFKTEAKLTHNI